jgi:uncharacterized metal-binding protein
MSDSTSTPTIKVGIISCSGEEIPEGTISRLATRRVLESLRSEVTVTLCLPLFLAGNEGERNFARTHPTITIDGCEKQCAKWGTEKHGGPVAGALVVSDILGTTTLGCSRSSRSRGAVDNEAVGVVAERIAAAVDVVMTQTMSEAAITETTSSESVEPEAEAVCACRQRPLSGRIHLKGEDADVAGLSSSCL